MQARHRGAIESLAWAALGAVVTLCVSARTGAPSGQDGETGPELQSPRTLQLSALEIVSSSGQVIARLGQDPVTGGGRLEILDGESRPVAQLVDNYPGGPIFALFTPSAKGNSVTPLLTAGANHLDSETTRGGFLTLQKPSGGEFLSVAMWSDGEGILELNSADHGGIFLRSSGEIERHPR